MGFKKQETRRPGRSINGKGFSKGARGVRSTIAASSLRQSEATSQNEKAEAVALAHSIDECMGFERYDAGRPKLGWLCNMHSTSVYTSEKDNHRQRVPGGRAAVDFYFIEEDGNTFKATMEYDPYFLIAVRQGKEADVEEWIRRGFEGLVKSVRRVVKEDLKMPNHLLGYRRTLLELRFANVSDLLNVRKAIMPIAEKNAMNVTQMDAYAEVACAQAHIDFGDDEEADERKQFRAVADASDFITDIREYDVPYHVRVAIDNDIRVGKWYDVEAKHGQISIKCVEEKVQRPDPVVMAFDIETTKLPLKFPDALTDQIMMISYMIDGQGFLITNRQIVGEDISDFEYTPRPEYPGSFVIFNEHDERSVIERFFEHIKTAKPTVIATYNGDFFDWPFVETRASLAGIDMYREIGFRKNSEDIYQSDCCAHMDAFAWVNRDSYLPQGSRGLKAVTVAKLGYDPDELDPELMTPYARERPQVLAEYSVSDAVATYYLYMKYVHPFIFSLCTIVPLGPDDTLRKGTGTLCEMLLMVQAYQHEIVLPNKHKPPREEFWEGHLLESETYVGGHVESIEAGVFRSDIPCDFKIELDAISELLDDLDETLKFFITAEEKKKLEDISDYEEVKQQIRDKLLDLKLTPSRNERPLIYHLDVASMYPNIMTTNRLQPDSMIQESDCAACDFNRPGKTCDRRLPWAWRGEYLPAKKDEYKMIRHALENERFPGKVPNSISRTFQDLSLDEQASQVKKRLQDYSKKIYHKIHDARTLEREAIICQRENPFYVNTVRDFRDRRYDYKGQQKVWKGKTEALKSSGGTPIDIEEAKKMIVLYDSLQLAHKVILNSFYGYVMRKGSRWFSMEMAGVTCLTGARIIQMARQLVERIGRPLELDTDGIWCILPSTFPENFAFTLKNGKKVSLSYPCAMLNRRVHAQFTNHQYQTLHDPTTYRYETHSDNSIFFEVDGPYRAMILPTSKEEDKNLKKRYAVFNHDGSLAELKGFEVKRRGELKLIKIFQTQIFKFFLNGTTLAETYASVATIADKWLNVLYEKGVGLADEELIDLICENKSMTKTLEEYGGQKSTAITTAKRLAEFLGEQMVKDKGLNCKYIISSRPRNAPVTDRAIPVAIFSANEDTKRFFLRKWMKDDPSDMDPRTVLDWNYYLERLGSVVQKLITIPAALQKIRNPVPRVAHPDWLDKRIKLKDDRFQQRKMTDLFNRRALEEIDTNVLEQRSTQLEDYGSSDTRRIVQKGVAARLSQKRKSQETVASVQTNPFASLPQTVPNITDDYTDWLRYEKQKWKIQRQQRQRRRQLFGEKRDDNNALGNMFKSQAELLYSSSWEILQLQPLDSSGEVRAFILIDGKVHTIKVLVPRRIFISTRTEKVPEVRILGCNISQVNSTLPNGQRSSNLFQLTMSEQAYLSQSQELAELFNHSSVEAVYESQLPLVTRAVLQLGSSCTFDETQYGVLGRGLENGFALASLRHAAPPRPYLSHASLNYLFLYHITTEKRQIFLLFSTLWGQASVVITNKTSDLQLPNLDKLYSELHEERLETTHNEPWQETIDYPSDLTFSILQKANTLKQAYKEISTLIRRARSETTAPLLLVIQSSDAKLETEIPATAELPTLRCKSVDSDKDLPPLGWQMVLARQLITRLLDLGSCLSRLTSMARYGNIPLCNLHTEDPRYLIDISFARSLQRENVVLWWNNIPKPDHGGHEVDDVLTPLEEVNMPKVNVPGSYSTVCVDVEVKNLLVNTILTSSLLNDVEGSDSFSFNPTGADGKDGSTVLAGDGTFSAIGIRVLRDLVRNWHAQATAGEQLADVMVSNLIGWLTSPSSHLYDPSLHRYLLVSSKKALQSLMADCRKVGAHVVHADTNRFLLQTTKSDVANARAYMSYVLKSIRAKPSFVFLDLEVSGLWDSLLWLDQWNFGGRGIDPRDQNQVTRFEEGVESYDTIMNWRLQQQLPAILQKPFHDTIISFIDLLHTRKRPEGVPSSRPTQLPLQNIAGQQAGDDADVGNLLSSTGFYQEMITTMKTLLRRYRLEMQNPDLATDWVNPVVPSPPSTEPQEAPLLTLTKMVMHILALDKPLALEIRLLRKDLLALFDVREFARQGVFQEQAANLCLKGVICAECMSIQDVDLCRDGEAYEHDNEPGSERAKKEPQYSCHHCSTPYTSLYLQEKLMSDVVQQELIRWCSQDSVCEKCRKLRYNEFMEHCACGGQWMNTVDKKSLVDKLRCAETVAGIWGWDMVEKSTGKVLQGIA